MLQRLGIRGKILAVVAVPILVLVLAAAFITYGASQDLSAARNSEDLIDTLDTARSLEEDLQSERYASVNFVHIIQDSSTKLVTGQNDTDDAFAALVAGIQGSDADNADALVAGVYDAFGVAGPDAALFEAERALRVEPPAEEGGWVTFPAADQLATMQGGYAAVQEALTAVAGQAPADLGGLFSTMDFRIGYESDTATTLFTEPAAYQEELVDVTADVDRGIQAMLGSTERLAANEDNASAVSALASGEQAIGNLESVRTGVRAGAGNVATYSGFYRTILETITGAADDVAVPMTDRGVVASLQAYGDIDSLIENMLYEKVQFERLIRAGSYQVGEATQARSLTARTDLSLEEAQNSSASVPGAEQVPGFGASVGFDSALDQQSYESVRAAIIRGTDTDLLAQRDAAWADQVDEEVAQYLPLRDELWSDIEESVAANAQNALFQTILTAIIAVLVVVASVVVALLIARRIVNPLRRLTTTATAVRQELPRLVERVAMPGEQVDVSEVQITVESRDEIGTLAEAFNGVNAATLGIAAEQAALRGSISEMFVNVARRDQVLLNRQLKSIDEMERTEDDPDTLTRLFALDHLATRMRRNSESLLVLAGIDTGRRLRRPMPLSDVIRTASSEIELYERVQLELDADPSMLGHSALTAAHLFAELLENATVFSDPGSPVVVRTMNVDGNYVVEIEDSGIGMTESELAEANNRVASTAASEILGAQRLGLFVVGRIARRVGARVEIASQESKGTRATVTMPPSLFASEADLPSGHVSATATDAATHAPAALVTHNEADEITEIPQRPSTPVGEAYTPAVIEEGGSLLSGRGGDAPVAASAPEPDPNSIEALIAADAADAPSGEQADLAALTEGQTGAGLPTRRRREAPAPADAEREQQSIVGLPARATDAQLSALEAEQSGGFMPTVSPSEVAPQSAEERASMFRGFRSRKATETEAPAPATEDGESLGYAARRDGLAASALAASNRPEDETPVIPSLEPDDADAPAPSAGTPAETDGPGLGGAAAATAGGAAAFGAAAFFGRKDDAPAQPSAQDAVASEPTEDQWAADAPAADAPVADAPSYEPESTPLSAASAPEATDSPWAAASPRSAPSVAEADTDATAADVTAPDVSDTDAPHGESAPAAASAPQAAPEDDGLPVFRMPKFEAAAAAGALGAVAGADRRRESAVDDHVIDPEARADAAPGASAPVNDAPVTDAPVSDAAQGDAPATAHDQAEPASHAQTPIEHEPSIGSPADLDGPMVIPSLEDDELSSPAAAREEDVPADEPAYGGVESVSLDDAPFGDRAAEQEPHVEGSGLPWESAAASAPEPASQDSATDAPAWAASAPAVASAPEADAWMRSEPVAPSAEPPAAPQPAADPAVGFAAGAPAYEPADVPEPEPASAQPSLDDLIQSAVDEDADQRPSFFTRLFGRSGRKGAATAAGAAAAGAAAGAAAQRASAPSQPSASAFEPVSAPEVAPSQASAPAQPSLYASAPSAPSASASAPAAFAPQAPAYEPEPSVDHQQGTGYAAQPPSAPSSPAPSAFEPEPSPTSFSPDPGGSEQGEQWPSRAPEPAAQPSAPSPGSWAPQDAGQQPASYSPEQLANPSGWEAAGANALQAAEPEGGTTYQPVIQPESGGAEAADMTSAVFSELSSLAAERPKVEKTRAGLQRRRPSNAAPVEVKPIEEEVSITPADRDADAVRSRFSSFYSGTQRARDDVAAFEQQTQRAEASDT